MIEFWKIFPNLSPKSPKAKWVFSEIVFWEASKSDKRKTTTLHRESTVPASEKGDGFLYACVCGWRYWAPNSWWLHNLLKKKSNNHKQGFSRILLLYIDDSLGFIKNWSVWMTVFLAVVRALVNDWILKNWVEKN